ncbi:ComF family protein [Thioalkalivibrio sp. HK1]|uniref:ComF family protein n=1 Tax=Thioalkalivibrio sp. HK1 TaxID=1469245 RepID=UPI00046EF471|nr:ComF family protein [Thioalkalivibrio sp. HK1]
MRIVRSALRAFFAKPPIFRIPPGFCLLCDEPARTIANLCDACARSLPLIDDPCRRCGGWAVPGTALCRLCARRAPTVARTLCALAYASPVSHLIGRLKFGGDLRVAPTLANLLEKRCEIRAREVDWLVPVPLGLPRLRSRGFNQALEIAKELKPNRPIPIASFVHRRGQSDAPQSSLPTIGARRSNVRDAFEVRGRLHGRVAIVDDVVTTGATVNALAKCLMHAGAQEVEVWAVARTP